MESPVQLDRLMAAAWPPATSASHGTWTFRHTGGVTRRANSVLVDGEPDDLATAVESAERFYEQRDSDAVFLLSDASAPPSVGTFLDSRGYRTAATTSMLTASANDVASIAGRSDTWSVDVADRASDEWFDVYWSVESARRSPSDRTVIRDVLLRPELSAAFVSVADGDGIVSVGQVVVDGRWACVQCLATSPDGRRRGAGRHVVGHLATEAIRRGASGIFTAVLETNEASLGLFHGLSFHRSHQYRYATR